MEELNICAPKPLAARSYSPLFLMDSKGLATARQLVSVLVIYSSAQYEFILNNLTDWFISRRKDLLTTLMAMFMCTSFES